MRFCPKCANYLYLNTVDGVLRRICKLCSYSEDDKEGGCVMETVVQERSSEGYKILVNEFTKDDPTLPHVDTLPCPNGACPTNSAANTKPPRDVIIIKYDAQNMKFLYICNVCSQLWRSRS